MSFGLRQLLPLVTGHAKRSALTCEYKCGNACFHAVPNPSDNEYFGDIVRRVVSRRGVMRAGLVLGAGGATAVAAGCVTDPEATNPDTDATISTGTESPDAGGVPGHQFDPVPANTDDAVTVPAGYQSQVVIAWGDPLFGDTPTFDLAAQTADAQRRQFGYNADFLGVLPLDNGDFLLCVNHEYTDEVLMFPGYDDEKPTRAQVEISWAAHGLTVVAASAGTGKEAGALTPIVDHELNRRFHTGTRFELTGPAAGHALLRTKADPTGTAVLGTLNNCAGGLTPWGTWLTAEENFNQYFGNGAKVTEPKAAAALKRYGAEDGPSGRLWEKFDPRFDLAVEPNEFNRFGWVVEVDPYDSASIPKKRTMLGRFKHEAANIAVAKDGRVVAYSGDDERFDYLYKFVSRDKMAEGSTEADRKHNSTLLDHGTLYVAKLTGNSPEAEVDGGGGLPEDGGFDGTGEWIALTTDTASKVAGMSVAEVLIHTRLAADTVGATKMDRPEDVEVNPEGGKVYVACTNNSKRTADQVDEANPRENNKHGQVIELTEAADDAAATTFAWSILLLCGDPADSGTWYAGYDKSQVSAISCPDNLAFDEHGVLWVSTDGNALDAHDGLFRVPLVGDERGHVEQFLTVPVGAETCGPYISDDRIMVCVQHPGETDDSTATSPSSHWPDGGDSVPRPAVVAVWKG